MILSISPPSTTEAPSKPTIIVWVVLEEVELPISKTLSLKLENLTSVKLTVPLAFLKLSDWLAVPETSVEALTADARDVNCPATKVAHIAPVSAIHATLWIKLLFDLIFIF